MPEYIEREWLLDLYDESKLTEKEKSYGVPFNIVRQNILDAPAVDAAPVVHGRWEREPASYWRWTPSGAVDVTRTTYRCGLCGRGTAVKSNYCPNCGAKMDGGECE